jgi:hypothetical protein
VTNEQYFLQATQEFDADERSDALWAKALALAEGDEAKAKYRYVTLRAEQLAQDDIRQQVDKPETASSRSLKSRVGREYIPVSQFAKLKGINEAKIIQMIRDGFYVGVTKDGEWYVHRDETNSASEPSQRRSGASPPSEVPTPTELPIEEFASLKGLPVEKAIAMVRDGFYVGHLENDQWYVSLDEASRSSQQNQAGSGNFFAKLVNGDFGLARTYWVFGVLVGIVVNVITIPITSIAILIMISLAHAAYTAAVLTGVWRASDRYTGPAVWAVLAKVAVVLGVISIFAGLIMILAAASA